ncbi:MAG: GAF domain-containing protein [Desulfomicrobium escambiense]|nr:GAF domain-containing protein [Desulfomicrobium escambiense]
MIGMMQDIHHRKQGELLQTAVYKIAQAADLSSGLDGLFRSVHSIVGTVMPARELLHRPLRQGEGPHPLPLFRRRGSTPPPRPVKARQGADGVRHPDRARSLLCDEKTDRILRSRGEVEIVGAPSTVWLGVPLIVDGKTNGAMVVQHYGNPSAYGPVEQRMLEFVSSQVARSIERVGDRRGPPPERAEALPPHPEDAPGGHRVGHQLLHPPMEPGRRAHLRPLGGRGRRAARRRSSSPRSSRARWTAPGPTSWPTGAASGAPTRTSPRTAGPSSASGTTPRS